MSVACSTYSLSSIVSILDTLTFEHREYRNLINGCVGKIPQQPSWLADIITQKWMIGKANRILLRYCMAYTTVVPTVESGVPLTEAYAILWHVV